MNYTKRKMMYLTHAILDNGAYWTHAVQALADDLVINRNISIKNVCG